MTFPLDPEWWELDPPCGLKIVLFCGALLSHALYVFFYLTLFPQKIKQVDSSYNFIKIYLHNLKLDYNLKTVFLTCGILFVSKWPVPAVSILFFFFILVKRNVKIYRFMQWSLIQSYGIVIVRLETSQRRSRPSGSLRSIWQDSFGCWALNTV